MPGYAWSCHVCGSVVPAGAQTCPACGAAAVLTGEQIEELRRTRAGLAPLTRKAPDPKRTGWLFVGAYGAILGLALLHIAVASGDMAGIVLLIPALPWWYLGGKLFGPSGFSIGFFAGLILNGALAFAAGYAITRRKTSRRRGM